MSCQAKVRQPVSTSARVQWKQGMVFEAELQGHHFEIDADRKFGGENRGPNPKLLLLAGLAGCTGMDVVAILRKMRQSWDSFYLEVDAETADSHPIIYTISISGTYLKVTISIAAKSSGPYHFPEKNTAP